MAPTILAVTPDLAPVLRLETARGRQISDADRGNPVCVLGDALARSLGSEGQPGQLLRLHAGQCRIVGVLRRFDPRRAKGAPVTARDFDHVALVPLGAAAVFGADGEDTLSEIVVQLRDSAQVTQAVPLIRRILALHHHDAGDFELIEPQALLQQARAMQSTFAAALGAITVICLLAGGVGVMNAMLASVVERRREIGVRRCLGARQRDIAAEFLAEAQLLCGSGGVLGLLLGALLAQTLSRWTGWPSVLDLSSMALSLLVALLTGALFGLYPAWLAARLDPIQALRHV
jgi:putative ABC transport system permease protein